MTVHPAADMFPMLSDAEMSELVRDIKARGLIEPIVACGKEIWDGRNRLIACTEAKVRPVFNYAIPRGITAHDYIISANIRRRHLTPAQKRDLIQGETRSVEPANREDGEGQSRHRGRGANRT